MTLHTVSTAAVIIRQITGEWGCPVLKSMITKRNATSYIKTTSCNTSKRASSRKSNTTTTSESSDSTIEHTIKDLCTLFQGISTSKFLDKIPIIINILQKILTAYQN